MRVIDASVLVKLFVAEPLSDEAAILADKAAELHAPAHGFAEVAEVLRRKHRLGQVDARQLRAALQLMPDLVEIHPIAPLLQHAVEIATEIEASVYDTLYIALAAREGWPLVTADKRLLDRAKTGVAAEVVRPLGPRAAG